MRSIGAVNKRKLAKIIKESYKRDLFGQINYSAIREEIKSRIPEEWYEIWESAYCEIENLIEDGLSAERRAV